MPFERTLHAIGLTTIELGGPYSTSWLTFLVWKWSSTAEFAHPLSHRSHRDFVSALCTKLLHSNDKEEDKEEEKEEDIPRPTTTALQRHHKHIKEEGKGRCQ
jgi:hypothetical protein